MRRDFKKNNIGYFNKREAENGFRVGKSMLFVMNKKPVAPKRTKSPGKRKLAARQAAEVKVTFKNGVGQLKIFLYRKGSLIASGEVNSSGRINFAEVQTDDIMVLNGTCAGDAKIEINVKTFPATPLGFTEEDINCLVRIA